MNGWSHRECSPRLPYAPLPLPLTLTTYDAARLNKDQPDLRHAAPLRYIDSE